MFDDEADFANRLFLLLIDEATEKSILFSPASILSGLTIFYVGCDGKTANEIEQIIGKGKSRYEIIDQFSSSLNHYKESYKNVKEKVKVKFVNNIFVSNFCEILPEFCQTMETKFDGGFQQLNFNDNKAAALEINNFVTTETNGKIENMITVGDIDQNITAVLVSAVYFKAPWNLLFEQTKMVEFQSNPRKTIKMMFREVPNHLWWSYVEEEKWTALGIPFANYKAWIHFVLPSEDSSLKELLQLMKDDNIFRKWTKIKESPFMNVTIPFISVEYEINMKENLEKLGMETAFTEECNSSNLTKCPIILNKVFHKSTVTIDEKGIEAVAASSFCFHSGTTRKPVHSFLANRPFLYFITTIKEPLTESQKAEAAKRMEKEYYHHPDFEDEILIDPSECSTEPYNLLFVGTFC